jgi:hypothetical protein
VNFLGGVGQSVCVDVDAYAAPRTLHVLARFQSSYALFKLMATVRTLKSYYVGVSAVHEGYLSVQVTRASPRSVGDVEHLELSSPSDRFFGQARLCRVAL